MREKKERKASKKEAKRIKKKEHKSKRLSEGSVRVSDEIKSPLGNNIDLIDSKNGFLLIKSFTEQY